MDIARLRCFVTVAETGHVTRAAALLGLQQPPLSQKLQALEHELGVRLLDRHAKGVTPTAAGRELVAGARPLLAQFERLQERMRQVAAGRAGTLAVAFTTSAAAHAFTPLVLRQCRASEPGVELRITEGNAAEIIEAVAARRVQVGLLRVPVARPEGVRFERLFSEPAVLALPVDHPIARQYKPASVVPLQALDGERLILVRRPGAPGLYANLLARLGQLGVVVEVAAEVERMLSNINLVASGGGVSIVPASMQGAHPQSVVYRALPADPAIAAPITLAWHADDGDAVTQRFLALVRRTAAAMDGAPAVKPARRRASAPATAR
jgi:DNA-binding transcriptional LysR family regulator